MWATHSWPPLYWIMLYPVFIGRNKSSINNISCLDCQVCSCLYRDLLVSINRREKLPHAARFIRVHRLKSERSHPPKFNIKHKASNTAKNTYSWKWEIRCWGWNWNYWWDACCMVIASLSNPGVTVKSRRVDAKTKKNPTTNGISSFETYNTLLVVVVSNIITVEKWTRWSFWVQVQIVH